MPFTEVRYLRPRWTLVDDPSGAPGSLIPRRTMEECSLLRTDDGGRFTLRLESWDPEAPGFLVSDDATYAGELPLPRDPPEHPLDDLVVRRTVPPQGPPEEFPEVLLRPVDAVTERALCGSWARVELLQGERVVGYAQSRSNADGLAHVWGCTIGDPQHPSPAFDCARVTWDVEGYVSGEQHVVGLVGRGDGEVELHRLTPAPGSLLLNGRVLRAGIPVSGAVVRAERRGAELANGSRLASFARGRTGADGMFALRVAEVGGHAIRIWAETPAGEWAQLERSTTPDGGVLDVVLPLEPMMDVSLDLVGLQPGLDYAYTARIETTSGSPWDPLHLETRLLDVDPNGDGVTHIRLPTAHRATILFLAREDGGIYDSVGVYDWNPAQRDLQHQVPLRSYFVVVRGSVEGVAPEEQSSALVVATRVGLKRAPAHARLELDGSFQLTTRRGAITVALLRPRPQGRGCDVLAEERFDLRDPFAEVVLIAARSR